VKAAVLGILLSLVGCATVDVYDYQARPLPTGTEPLAAFADSLRDLHDVSWSWGAPDPDPGRRAVAAATRTGVQVQPNASIAAGPLDLTYAEIVDGVRMVTQMHGSWTVYIYDRYKRLVLMEFNSYRGARMFLDAASALARS
jgi:hypothetical protein